MGWTSKSAHRKIIFIPTMNQYPPNGESHSTMAHLPAVAIALLSVGITVSFYFYQVLSPSAGARLKPGGFNWLPEGVRVEQLVPQPDGLATGARSWSMLT